jgi:hypothetical protein
MEFRKPPALVTPKKARRTCKNAFYDNGECEQPLSVTGVERSAD